MALRSLRRWKVSLSEKFVDVSRITKWNAMVVNNLIVNGAMTGVTLKVKHSVTQDNYVKSFRGDCATLNILRCRLIVYKDAVPS